MILAYPHPHRAHTQAAPWWRSREKVASVALVGLAHVALFAVAARQLADRPAPVPTPDPITLTLAPPPLTPVERATDAAPSRPTVAVRPTPSPTPVADPVLTPLAVDPGAKVVIPELASTGAGPANGTGTGVAAAPDPVVRAPAMPRAPGADEMARFYPERAQRAGVEGHAVIECVVTIGGRAEACRVLSETPGGYGSPNRGTGLPVDNGRLTSSNPRPTFDTLPRKTLATPRAYRTGL